MALTTVTLHGQILELDGLTPAVGTVTFKTLIELNDIVDNVTYAPSTFVATLDVNGEFTIALPATDNPDIRPLNWVYQAFVSTTTWRETIYFQLPFAVGTVEFADLVRLDYDPCVGVVGQAPIPADCVCVPPGGEDGQVLAKASDLDFDIEWVDQSGGGGGGTTSGFVWDGAAYVLDPAQSLYVGPAVPGAPQQGDIWFNTVNGTATVQGFNPATSLPTTVTAGGVAHTKGPWTEIIASTDTPMAEIILLVLSSTSLSGTGLRGTLADVGIGPIGSEVAVVSNIDIGRTSGPQQYRLPVFVPAGSRISVRTQSLTPSVVFNVQVAASTAPIMATYFGGNWIYAGTGSTGTVWGVSTANSLPLSMGTPAAVNTWSAWFQIELSTAFRIRYLTLLPSGPITAGWTAAVNALFDVGVGAIGSETSVLDSGALSFTWNTTEAVARAPLTVGVDIPAGSRITMRWQADNIGQPASGSVIGFS